LNAYGTRIAQNREVVNKFVGNFIRNWLTFMVKTRICMFNVMARMQSDCRLNGVPSPCSVASGGVLPRSAAWGRAFIHIQLVVLRIWIRV